MLYLLLRSTAFSLLIFIFSTQLTQAQGRPDQDGLFIISPTKRNTNAEADSKFDIKDETVLEDARRNMSDEDKASYQQQKVDLYNSFVDNIQSKRWKSAIEDLEKYQLVVNNLYGPKDDLYADVFGDMTYNFGLAYAGIGEYLEAVKAYQRVFWQFKNTKYAPKAVFEWAKIFYKGYIGEIKIKGQLPMPTKEILLKRLDFVKTIKPDEEAVADCALMAADVCIRNQDKEEATKYLDFISSEWPRSVASDSVDAYRDKLK